MKLTIEMKSPTSFVIVEQNTGKRGFVNEPLYEDDSIYICQRVEPEFTISGDFGKPTLYLRGNLGSADEKTIVCGPYIYKVLCTLKKAFDEFKVLNCNKFVLEKQYD